PRRQIGAQQRHAGAQQTGQDKRLAAHLQGRQSTPDQLLQDGPQQPGSTQAQGAAQARPQDAQQQSLGQQQSQNLSPSRAQSSHGAQKSPPFAHVHQERVQDDEGRHHEGERAAEAQRLNRGPQGSRGQSGTCGRDAHGQARGQQLAQAPPDFVRTGLQRQLH